MLTLVKTTKPTDKLKLVLLPPDAQQEVNREDIKKFYTDLIKILVDED